jgi:ketosteroid isomerase-like protein
MNQLLREDMALQVMQLAEEWATAELRGDAVFLSDTLADDYVAIGPRGFMLTREDWLQRHQSGALHYSSFTLSDVQVRLYGDAAVLTGRETQTGMYQGQDIPGEFRTTLVWVRLQGRWQLAGLHLSPILPPPSAPPGR